MKLLLEAKDLEKVKESLFLLIQREQLVLVLLVLQEQLVWEQLVLVLLLVWEQLEQLIWEQQQ